MNVDRCCCGWLEKMRWRRRARVVFPLEEGPERAIMDVFVMIFCDLFLSISVSSLEGFEACLLFC